MTPWDTTTGGTAAELSKLERDMVLAVTVIADPFLAHTSPCTRTPSSKPARDVNPRRVIVLEWIPMVALLVRPFMVDKVSTVGSDSNPPKIIPAANQTLPTAGVIVNVVTGLITLPVMEYVLPTAAEAVCG